MNTTQRWTVTRDGATVSPNFTTEPEAFGWLLNHQSASVDHATKHEGYAIVAGPELDEQDESIRDERKAWLADRSEPGVGDFLDYGDTMKRIAHVWDFKDGSAVTVQPTSGAGSFYLGGTSTLGGGGYITHSGGLETGIAVERLTEIGKKAGRVWFFHHDYATAHNGVDVFVTFRVWKVAA